MKTLIVLAIGFYIGVSYTNGSLDAVFSQAQQAVNTGAEQVAAATEPTAQEQIELRYQELAAEVEKLMQGDAK